MQSESLVYYVEVSSVNKILVAYQQKAENKRWKFQQRDRIQGQSQDRKIQNLGSEELRHMKLTSPVVDRHTLTELNKLLANQETSLAEGHEHYNINKSISHYLGTEPLLEKL